MNWKDLVYISHYQTAIAIKEFLEMGNTEETRAGIEELIEALGRSEKRALRSQLTRLMMHIIKWKIQPERRSRSWLMTIENARVEIAGILKDEPSLKSRMPELWEECFEAATRLAQKETRINSAVNRLSWQDVFEEEYFFEQ